MNKYFALSLLIFSSSIAYGMHYKKYYATLEVEIKLPKHFEQKLTNESTTNFSIALVDSGENEPNPTEECIFGISSNTDKEFIVTAGKGLADSSFDESLSIIFPKKDLTIARLALARQGRFVPEGRYLDNCKWDKKITFICKVGEKAKQSVLNGTSGEIEISIAPRLIRSDLASTECCEKAPIRPTGLVA